MMTDIETIWIASLALLSALLVYPLARKGSRFHWFGLLSIVLLFAMAVDSQTGQKRVVRVTSTPSTPNVQPTFAGIDPATSKYFEGLWLVMQDQKSDKDTPHR